MSSENKTKETSIDLIWASQKLIGFEKMMKQAQSTKESEQKYREQIGYIPTEVVR